MNSGATGGRPRPGRRVGAEVARCVGQIAGGAAAGPACRRPSRPPRPGRGRGGLVDLHVLRRDQAERGQHAGRLEGRRAVAVHQVFPGGTERGVVRDQVRERTAGQQQFARRIPVAVVARQRQVGEPRVVARLGADGAQQAEHRVGDPPRAVVVVVRLDRPVVGGGDGGAGGRVLQRGPGRRLDRAKPGEQRMRRRGVDHPQPEHGELAGLLESRSRQQQPARAAGQPAVGERNRQRAELGAFLGRHRGERRVQLAPPPGVLAQPGEQVGQLRERHPAHPEHRVRGMPGRPVDEVRQHRGEQPGQPGRGGTEQHRVPRPYPRAAHRPCRVRGRVARRLRRRQERHVGQQRDDGAAQPGGELTAGDRPGHQVKHARRGRELRQQRRVRRRGALDEEVRQRPGRDVPPVRAERE